MKRTSDKGGVYDAMEKSLGSPGNPNKAESAELDYVLCESAGDYMLRMTKEGRIEFLFHGMLAGIGKLSDITKAQVFKTDGETVRNDQLMLCCAIAFAQVFETLRHAAGAYKTAETDRAEICKMGALLLNSDKQCYSAEAVTRAVIVTKEELERLKKEAKDNEGL
jgi:hypothetical protein